MAVTVYQCTKCNRRAEIQRDKRSLEVINRCVITQNCRGEMVVVKFLDDYSRGRNPDPAPGLDDWNQRKVLYDHRQSAQSDSWTIKHDMKSFPKAFVFVPAPTEDDPDKVVAKEPIDEIVVNENVMILKFDRPYSGRAQLVSNTTFSDSRAFADAPVEDPLVKLSNQGELSIAEVTPAVHYTVTDVYATWFFPSGTSSQATYKVDDVQSVNSPWRTFKKLEIGGKTYETRSFGVRNFKIPAGSHVTFTGTKSNAAPEAAEFLILISRPPFDIFDVDKTRVLDLAEIKDDPLAIAYDGEELYVKQSKLKSVFPHVKGL